MHDNLLRGVPMYLKFCEQFLCLRVPQAYFGIDTGSDEQIWPQDFQTVDDGSLVCKNLLNLMKLSVK